MSREQWGHGYYQGKKEAFLPEVLRSWVVAYDAHGNITHAGRVVRNHPEDRALLEEWSYTDLCIFVNHGLRPGAEIDESSLTEVYLPPERSNYFASWDGFLKELEKSLT